MKKEQPNQESIEAMEDAKNGNVTKFNSVEELFKSRENDEDIDFSDAPEITDEQAKNAVVMPAIKVDNLKSISVDNLISYLIDNGWKQVDRIGDKALIFHLERLNKEVVVPLDVNLGDFTIRTMETIQILLEIEKTYEIEVMKFINKLAHYGEKLSKCLIKDEIENNIKGL